jgi:hypothetical protein
MRALIEPAHAEYIRELSRARLALKDQLADVYKVLSAVTEGASVDEEGSLGSARAAYAAYLRESHLTFEQLIEDIAEVCACAYFWEISA